MRALVLNGPYDFSYEDRPDPVCPPDHVVVRVEAVCICGSDIHAIQGHQPLFTFPRVIGHEVAGTVYKRGRDVTDLAVGDRVCLMPCIPCGTCRACRKGRTNACSSLELYGVHRDGGLQEYLAAPAVNWLKIPGIPKAEAVSMLEPLTIGAHAVAKLDLQPGDRVLVVGAGPIGMSCAVNARTYGAQVVLADSNPQRRAFCQDTFRLPALDPFRPDYLQTLRQITDGDLFDGVVDTTAAKASMETDWKWICQGGRIVFVGICSGTLEVDGLSFHMREPGLMVTRNSTRRDFERVLEYWRLGFLDPEQFITHTVPFDQAAQALGQWIKPETGVFKGVVQFPV